MNLTCIPSGSEVPDRNFVEVQCAHRGHSEGPPLSARDLAEKLVVVLHDRTRHRGCLAPCDTQTPVFDTISAMRHYMVNHWGSRPQDVDVLLAGGQNHNGEFSASLRDHLRRLQLHNSICDARSSAPSKLGQGPQGAPVNHLYYYPTSARVELVCDQDEPGGRAYQSQNSGVTLSATA